MFVFLLGGCSVGPDYKKPCMKLANKYKEAPSGWKLAEPNDAKPKGKWWVVFSDPYLNTLEEKLNVSNLNIVQSVAQFKQSLAIIEQTRSAYWPNLAASASGSRNGPSATTGRSFGDVRAIDNSTPFNSYAVQPTLTWSPDLFGVVRRAVEAAEAGAQASAAQLAFTQLSMQALLAQTYFQLRALDQVQFMLDDTVKSYLKSLQLTQNQYAAGIVSRLNTAQAQTQLESAQAQQLDNRILRSQYEHAIAVLVGATPEGFTIVAKDSVLIPPSVPLELPSTLLERRPDIAQAERLMAQANYNIGLQIAAFYPIVTISASDGFSSNFYRALFNHASNVWSWGAAITETFVDGGLRTANLKVAIAVYEQNLAAYKQTVLTALQEVEDNLVALRILNKEIIVQQAAVKNAQLALDLTMNQYKAGTVDYLNVIVQQTLLYNSKQVAAGITSRQMVAAVGLVQALGGGWSNCCISELPSVVWESNTSTKIVN